MRTDGRTAGGSSSSNSRQTARFALSRRASIVDRYHLRKVEYLTASGSQLLTRTDIRVLFAVWRRIHPSRRRRLSPSRLLCAFCALEGKREGEIRRLTLGLFSSVSLSLRPVIPRNLHTCTRAISDFVALQVLKADKTSFLTLLVASPALFSPSPFLRSRAASH